MADARFCVGFSNACKQAREGGGLPGYAPPRSSRGRALRPFLPPDIIRLIDALVRRLEHEDRLLSMNGCVLGTTLCQAAAAGGLRDVRFLLARGADVEATTVFPNDDVEILWTALEWSSRAGHLEVVVALVDAGAGRIDAALLASSFNGHTPVVALLLDRGADVHFQEDEPFVVSALNNHLATATLHLDRGAAVDAQDGEALGLAAQSGHLEMVALLLDRGSDIHLDEDHALLAASENGQLEVVRLLLDRGADIHADNEEALVIARQMGHDAVVALLLQRGALEPEEE